MGHLFVQQGKSSESIDPNNDATLERSYLSLCTSRKVAVRTETNHGYIIVISRYTRQELFKLRCHEVEWGDIIRNHQKVSLSLIVFYIRVCISQ